MELQFLAGLSTKFETLEPQPGTFYYMTDTEDLYIGKEKVTNMADIEELKKILDFDDIQLDELFEEIGKVADLTTDDKTSLVNALNEVLDRLKKEEKNSVVTLDMTPGEAEAKIYTFKQGGNVFGTINIPKDLVVSKGEVIDVEDSSSPDWEAVGEKPGTYIVLTLNNTQKLYINAEDLVDIYTVSDTPTAIQLTIDGYTVSAEIKDKAIKLGMIADNVLTIDNIQGLRDELNSLINQGDDQTEKNEELDKKDQELQESIDRLTDQLTQASEQLKNDMEAADTAIKEDLAQTKSDLEAADTAIKEEVADNKAAQEAADQQLQSNLDAAKKTLEDADAALKKEMTEANEQLQQNLDNVETELKNADTALDEKFTQANEDLQNAMTEADAQLKQDLTDAQSALEAEDAAIKKEVADNKVAQDEVNKQLGEADVQLRQELTDAQTTLEAADEAIKKDLEAAKSDLQAADKDLEDKLTTAQSELEATDTQLRNDLEAAKGELQDADEQLEQKINDNKTAQDAANAAMEKEITDNKAAAEAADAAIRQEFADADEQLKDELTPQQWTVEIPVSGWGDAYPFTNTVSVSGVTATMDVKIIGLSIPSSTSQENVKALNKAAAMLMTNEGGVTDGSITFSAHHKPPISFSLVLEEDVHQ